MKSRRPTTLAKDAFSKPVSHRFKSPGRKFLPHSTQPPVPICAKRDMARAARTSTSSEGSSTRTVRVYLAHGLAWFDSRARRQTPRVSPERLKEVSVGGRPALTRYIRLSIGFVWCVRFVVCGKKFPPWPMAPIKMRCGRDSKCSTTTATTTMSSTKSERREAGMAASTLFCSEDCH